MEFDKKAAVVAECWMIVREQEVWKDLLKYGDLGYPLAYAYDNGMIELKDKARNFVEEVYDVMLASLGIPDEDYENFEALLDKNIAMNPEPEDSEPTD
jgi:hypothetical protein